MVNMVQHPDKDKNMLFIVTFFHKGKLIQGTIQLPVGSMYPQKEDFSREDYEYYDYLVYEQEVKQVNSKKEKMKYVMRGYRHKETNQKKIV